MAGYFRRPGADATLCLVYSALLLVWALAAATTAGKVVFALVGIIPLYHAVRSWNGPDDAGKGNVIVPAKQAAIFIAISVSALIVPYFFVDRIPDLGVPGWAVTTFIVVFVLVCLPITFLGVPWRRDKKSNGTTIS